MKNIIKNNKTFYFLGVIFIILVWVISANVINNEFVVPKFNVVVNSLIELLSKFRTYKLIMTIVFKVLIVLVITMLIAGVLSIISILSLKVENLVRPIILVMRTVPVAAFIMVILVIFFSKRHLGTIVISSFVTIPIIYEAIIQGIKNVDKNIVEDIKMVSNKNVYTIFKIYIPLAMPSIIIGITQSFGLSFKVLIMSEVIMLPNNSIGKDISDYAYALELSYVFAWSIILLFIVLLLDNLLCKVRINY